jgi:hypothetical protein
MSDEASENGKTAKYLRQKYRSLKDKLTEENWTSWKREITAVLRDRDLDGVTFGTEPRPTLPEPSTRPATRQAATTPDPGDTPEAIDEWKEKSKLAYNQILLNISAPIQPLLDSTAEANEAWSLLLSYFEAKNASLTSTVRALYEGHMYEDGSSMLAYVARLTDLRQQLGLLDEPISDQAHGNRLLMNLPDTEEWKLFAMTIRNITSDPVTITQRLLDKYAHDRLLQANNASNSIGTRTLLAGAQGYSSTSLSRQQQQYKQQYRGKNRRGNRGGRSFNYYDSTGPRDHTNRLQNQLLHPFPPNQSERRPKCNYCHKLGHLEAGCYKKAYDTLHGPTNNPTARSDSSPGTIIEPKPKPNTSDSFIAKIEESFPRQLSLMCRISTTTSVDLLSKRYRGINDIDTPSLEQEPVLTANVSRTPTDSSSLPRLEEWCLDSGATSHLCNNRKLFLNIHTIRPLSVDTASGQKFHVTEIGDIHCYLRSYDDSREPDVAVVLRDVLFVPRLPINLISIARLANANLTVEFQQKFAFISYKSMRITTAARAGNLYVLETVPLVPTTALTVGSKIIPTARNLHVWHLRLNHVSYETIKWMSNLGMVSGLSPDNITQNEETTVCISCPFGKQTRAKFNQSQTTYDQVGQLIHSDFLGPFERSVSGKTYVLSWIDEYSKYAVLDFTSDRSSATAIKSFDAYIRLLGQQTNKKIMRLRTDNDGAYTSKGFQQLLSDNGVIHETTIPHTPEQNGVAERFNRTIQESTLILRHQANFPKSMWAETMSHAVYVYNRVWHSAIRDIPYIRFWKSKPSLSLIRIFGCRCWGLIPKSIRRKGDYRSMEGQYIGVVPGSKGFKVWNIQTKKSSQFRDVIFDEKGVIEQLSLPENSQTQNQDSYTQDVVPTIKPALIPNSDTSDSDDEYSSATSSHSNRRDHHSHQHDNAPVDITFANQPLSPLPESTSQELPAQNEEVEKAQPDAYEGTEAPNDFERGVWLDPTNETYGRGKRHSAHLGSNSEFLAYAQGNYTLGSYTGGFLVLSPDEPANLREAMGSRYAREWKEGMDKEYRSHIEEGTWKLVPRPKGKNVVRSRWTYRLKMDSSGKVVGHKSRLVAQGFSQIYGIDFNETYAPTARAQTIRFLLAFAAKHDYEVIQIDVKTAFLNGILEEEVYMEQPEGYRVAGKENWVCHLIKSIYGLHQSARVWFETLSSALATQNLTPAKADEALFYRKEADNEISACSFHVDDGLFIGKDLAQVRSTIDHLAQHFEIKYIGPPKFLLGIKIDRNRENKTISLSQPSYIETIAKRFKITESGKRVGNPMDPRQKLVRNQDPVDPSMINIPYTSAIGSLNYAAISTRPDIAFAVNRLAQFVSSPTTAHWIAVEQIFKYLLDTKHYGITFGNTTKSDGFCDNLVGYTDADFAGDLDDRKSTSGWIYRYYGGPVSWASRKQRLVTRSSFESELVSASQASAEGVWLLRLAKDLNEETGQLPLFTDNRSCVAFTERHITHDKTKHIDVHYFYVRDLVEKNIIKVYHIAGTDNPADILTKPLPPYKHKRMCSILGISDCRT